jgi:hypothetical protein
LIGVDADCAITIPPWLKKVIAATRAARVRVFMSSPLKSGELQVKESSHVEGKEFQTPNFRGSLGLSSG